MWHLSARTSRGIQRIKKMVRRIGCKKMVWQNKTHRGIIQKGNFRPWIHYKTPFQHQESFSYFYEHYAPTTLSYRTDCKNIYPFLNGQNSLIWLKLEKSWFRHIFNLYYLLTKIGLTKYFTLHDERIIILTSSWDKCVLVSTRSYKW